jgi:hypothetical protein
MHRTNALLGDFSRVARWCDPARAPTTAASRQQSSFILDFFHGPPVHASLRYLFVDSKTPLFVAASSRHQTHRTIVCESTTHHGFQRAVCVCVCLSRAELIRVARGVVRGGATQPGLPPPPPTSKRFRLLFNFHGLSVRYFSESASVDS